LRILENLARTSDFAFSVFWRKLCPSSQEKELQVDAAIILQFRVNGCELLDGFFVVPGLSEETIIGAKTMRSWRIKLDFENGEVRATKLRI